MQEEDNAPGEVRQSSVNDERSSARRVVQAGAGESRNVHGDSGEKLAGAAHGGDGSRVRQQVAEANAARTQVNGTGTPVLGARGVMVVPLGSCMGSMPFSHEVQGVLEEFANGRDQSPIGSPSADSSVG